jgi:hypothetical protein
LAGTSLTAVELVFNLGVLLAAGVNRPLTFLNMSYIDIVMFEEPRLAVFLILLEWNSERIGNMNGLAVVLP